MSDDNNQKIEITGDVSGGTVNIGGKIVNMLTWQAPAWQSIVLYGLLLILIALTALGVLPDTQRDNVLHSVGMIPASATATPTPTATLTPSNTPLPTNTPTITPTPLEGTPFAGDVIGVVLANFDDFGGEPEARVRRIELAFEEADVDFIRVHHTLTGREDAQRIGELYGAAIVIWGESYDIGDELRFEMTPNRGQIAREVEAIAVSANLPNFQTYLLEGMDALYIVDFVQGQIALFKQDYETAVSYFEAAEARVPEGREQELEAAALFFYLGFVYAQLERPVEQELEYYTRAIDLDLEFAGVAYYNRGLVHYDLGEIQLAIDDFDRAIEIGVDPGLVEDFNLGIDNFAAAYAARGAAYATLENYDQAIADYNKAIELDPDDSFGVSYAGRGDIYYTLENYDRAIADYTTAIDKGGPSDALVNALNIDADAIFIYIYYRRGNVYYEQGEYELAIADFDQIVALVPDDPYIHYRQGGAYYALGGYEQAVASYTTGITYCEIGCYYHYEERGDSYYALGEFENAAADYCQYAELTGSLTDEMAERVSEAGITCE